MKRKMGWAALMILSLLPGLAKADDTPMEAEAPIALTSPSAILCEASTGRVVFEKNADERLGIASTTKIMTALVVLEHCALDEPVEILPEYTAVEGSSMYLRAGETYTVEELLYGLMLDRMGLSSKHGWYDELGRVYIYYTLDEIQTDLMCGHNKAVRLLAELDTGQDGFGLIERVKQGQGRPAKIYVKKFTTTDVPEAPLSAPISDFPDSEIQTSQNQTSRLPLLGSQDFPKQEASYLDNIYPEFSYPDPSIYPAQAPPDGYDRFGCRKQLYEKLDYEILITEYGETSVKSIIELLTDTLCTSKPSVRIGGEEIPIAAVRERLGQLDRFHITYVLDCMQKTNTPIRNIRAYLLAALYQAPTTIDSYYRAAVRADCDR